MRSIVVECVVPLVPSRADEVETMAKSIGYEVVDRVIQHRKSLHHTYCIGPGKLDEVKQLTSEEKKKALRERRRELGFPIVALAGYTQSGKTTFFNRMVAEHKATGLGPFTTLSTFARRVDYQNGADAFSFILIDSIGFIEDMHPIIIKAFNTTLGEISDSDLILLFIDISEDEEIVFRKIIASNETLKRIDTNVPLIVCVNKIDRCGQDQLREGEMLVSRVFPKTPQVALSALKGQNTQEVVRLGYQQLNGGDGQKTLELHSSS